MCIPKNVEFCKTEQIKEQGLFLTLHLCNQTTQSSEKYEHILKDIKFLKNKETPLTYRTLPL